VPDQTTARPTDKSLPRRACAGCARRASLHPNSSMKLMTAHRILIASAIIFFAFFALWELNRYGANNDYWTMARGVLYFLVALGFAIYFKQLKRWYK
jgi:hypothetical protein